MLSNGRKTIGVFITQIYQEFQDVLSRGICKRAKDYGYNVAFFTNFIGYGEQEYERGELNIADLPLYEELDGIVIVPDIMDIDGFEKRVRDNISKYATCPIVSIRQKDDEYYSVVYDEGTALDDVIYHFVRDHGYKKINFLTGPENSPVALHRLESYRRIMKEFDLPYSEDQIYYGDFWRVLPFEAVNKWFSNPADIPEAIICANDIMAMTVCKALKKKGYSVPGDVAVAGFDNIELSEDYNPSITTGATPIYKMGETAVDIINKRNNGINPDKVNYLSVDTIIRESCGCKIIQDKDRYVSTRDHLIDELSDKDRSFISNAYMSIDLTGVTKKEVLFQRLSEYTNQNDGFSSFFMCLYQDWDIYEKKTSDYYNNIVMEFGIKEDEWFDRKEVSRRELLPKSCLSKEPQIFFFNMLHHRDRCFGYTAISFHKNQVYQFSYQGWIINISNALENISMHSEMNRLLFRMEDMYVKDELTGLYNRRGLQALGHKYLKQCIEEQCKFMVLSADMDNLKLINDNFGHASGDKAIVAVADALLAAAEDDELCIRMGGDEFAVIGIEYDDNKMERFIQKFEKAIYEFNRDSRNSFKVNISYGWSITLPNKYTKIEDCHAIADANMYKQKSYKASIRKRRLEEIDVRKVCELHDSTL